MLLYSYSAQSTAGSILRILTSCCVQALLDTCDRLQKVTEHWTVILRTQSASQTASDGINALKLDLSRLEGVGFCLLCHPISEVRHHSQRHSVI